MWLWLLVACGEDSRRIETLEQELQTAQDSIVALETELAQRKRRQESLERLDAAMEDAHTVVEARCSGPIHQSDTEETYEMNGAGVDEVLGDLSAAVKQGRWIPHGPLDSQAGWRLVKTAYGGLYSSCGLRPADVLVAINGLESQDLDPLVKNATDRALQEGRVEFSLLRNRKPLTIQLVRE